VRDRIGLDQMRAAFDKHFAHGRFAARDAASKAESEQKPASLDETLSAVKRSGCGRRTHLCNLTSYL
jgi:hypothetical protein